MSQMQRLYNLIFIVISVYISTLFLACASGQRSFKSVGDTPEVKSVFFRDANIAMETAKRVKADILAPKNFAIAIEYYKAAEGYLEKGNKLDDIRMNLGESCAYFQKAIDAVKLAEIIFTKTIKARMDAQFVESDRHSTAIWTEAESKFKEAAGILEDGNINDARQAAATAEKLYRKAELNTIKNYYLSETKVLLKQADDLDVVKYAPKTLADAKKLIHLAEKELNENRYDVDLARSFAWYAKRQAKHAIYLAGAIKDMQSKNQTWEDLMLASEIPLQQISEKIDYVASFDTGLENTTNEIIAYITAYQDSVSGLSLDIYWYKMGLYLQNARITELMNQFGSKVKENTALTQKLADYDKIHTLITGMEHSFSRNEAKVLQDGNDIIIRLVGLKFLSAEATIEQESFALLIKVCDAISSFQGATISVLGHTDSYGSDEQNLLLSKERAEAVKQFILADTNIVISSIESIGFGESKPIANNETESGRATNRRVEVVIHPG